MNFHGWKEKKKIISKSALELFDDSGNLKNGMSQIFKRKAILMTNILNDQNITSHI